MWPIIQEKKPIWKIICRTHTTFVFIILFTLIFGQIYNAYTIVKDVAELSDKYKVQLFKYIIIHIIN